MTRFIFLIFFINKLHLYDICIKLYLKRQNFFLNNFFYLEIVPNKKPNDPSLGSDP